jgi:putative transposase
LDDFTAESSTEIVTRPDPGSTDHTNVDPGPAPKIAATASGMVVRTDSERSIVFDTLDLKVPTIDSSLTLIGGRLHNYALHVGLQIANTLKYYVAYSVRQQQAQVRRAKLRVKRMPTVGSTEWWNERAWTDQRTPSLAIVARGDQITSTGPNEWTVCSQSQPGSFYHVKKNGAWWLCDCAFFGATGKVCVHILAVRYREGLQDSATAPKEKPRCDRCKSVDVTPDGVRHNKSGEVARYECRSCGRKFSGVDGFHNRRADPEKIALALDLYFRGLSLRKIADHFRQVHNLKLSAMTIYRWVTHYSRLAAEWMDAQGARTSDRWHIDETVVNVNGANTYLWNVLDSESRFLLATHISHNRSLENTRAPLRKAKHATPDRPFEVMSDGMQTYPEAIGKELGRKATAEDLSTVTTSGWSPILNNGRLNPHHRVPSIRAKESNNKIERFHGTEKERTKVMRAFDGETGASVLAEGFRVHYNLVRDHQALGMTPGEAAGIPMGGGFRWLTVLKEATKPTPNRAVSSRGTVPAP